MNRPLFVVGCLLAGSAVGLGAWAAHGLEDVLMPLYEGQEKEVAGQVVPAAAKYVGDFRTGVTYQMWHALAVLALGLAGGRSRLMSGCGWCFVAGACVFSGSLYALALTGITKLGAITPIGGLLFLIGWGLLMFAKVPMHDDLPQHEAS